jgi:hypothetical protein
MAKPTLEGLEAVEKLKNNAELTHYAVVHQLIE